MTLDVNHYLDAATRASDRGRKVIFALLVASVLILAAMMNSMRSNWMRVRLNELKNAHGTYVTGLVGPGKAEAPQPEAPAAAGDPAKDAQAHREKRYDMLYEAYVHEFVANTFFVKVPLFGFAFDINNLGIIGGLSFIMLLLLLRYSVLRELGNLTISFREVRKQGYPAGEAQKFYELLAMEQVLTIPQDRDLKFHVSLRILPKLLFWVPAAVFVAVFVNDLCTGDIAKQLVLDSQLLQLYVVECVWLLVILCFTVEIYVLLRRIDQVWDEEWQYLHSSAHQANPAAGDPT